MRYYRAIAILPLLLTALLHAQESTPIALNLNQSHDVTLTAEPGGTTKIVTTGSDLYVYCKTFLSTACPTSHTTLAFEFFCPDGIDGLTVYYGPPIKAGHLIDAGSTGRAESWMPFSINLATGTDDGWTRRSNLLRLDFGRRAGLELRIKNIVLRKPNTAELRSLESRKLERQNKIERADRLSRLYTQPFTASIGSIVADSRSLRISGSAPKRVDGLHLIELAPWVTLGDQPLSAKPLTLGTDNGVMDLGPIRKRGSFLRRLPRKIGHRDRITSRFALAVQDSEKRYTLRSAPRYVTNFDKAARQRLKSARRRSSTKHLFKGMAGVSPTYPLEELVELGIRHITANIVLSDLVSFTSRPGWSPFESGGQTWFANPSSLNHHDILIRFATEHKMIVSAILLIPFSENAFAKRLIHPEADRAGHYAMPNLTSAAGVAAYSAAITLLSRRYAQKGDPQGRITNWIIHNEVDYGWEWTNMGSQPPMLYFDTLMRSMRLVHNLVRRDNPEARVFVSLTHNWKVAADPKWRSYGSLPLLKRLNIASRIEGDFAWGVAFHPYPQSLWKADAWNDSGVTDTIDTPMITPKNLQVLGQWMELPESRDAKGKVRAVLLSEQGFHTDNSPRSRQVQGAAFVYIWRKIRELPMVEAFHNHRWIDHPQEGGLMLGLRTLPTPDAPYGEKKFAWEVYRALDTRDEKSVTAFAEALIQTPRAKDQR